MTRNTAAAFSFSTLLAYAWLGLCSGALFFLEGDGVPVMNGVSWKVAAVIAFVWYFAARPRILPEAFFFVFAGVVFTDFPERRNGLHLSREIFLLLTGAFAVILARPQTRALLVRFLRLPLLVAAQLSLACFFLSTAGGRIFWSDDHPSFLYRLILLRDHFPFLPFYNTDWNAGSMAREIYPTGALNLYLLGFPFVHWLGDLANVREAHVYTWLVVWIICGVVPLSTYFAARLMRLSAPAATAGALLALAPSTAFFEYALRYGTLPFLISAALLPLSVGLLGRAAFGDRPPSVSFSLAAGLVTFLAAAWHPVLVGFVPATLVLLVSLPRLRGRIRSLLLIGTIAAALTLPSVYFIFEESPLVQLLTGRSLPGSANTATLVQATAKTKDSVHPKQESGAGLYSWLGETRRGLTVLAAKSNALTLLLLVPALFALTPGREKRLMCWTAGGLAVTALCLSPLKPQLELHRLLLPVELVGCLAVGALLCRMLEDGGPSERRGLTLAAAAIGFAGLFTSVHSAADVYLDRSNLKLVFAPTELDEFVAATRGAAGDGRVLFASFILHDFGSTHYDVQDGGHVAPLAAFTGAQMYASHYYHAYWSTIDPIPEEFRARDDAGTEEFLDLMNVSSVVTFRREWTEYCRKSGRYDEVWEGERFHLFRRKEGGGGWVLRGSGSVRRTFDGIEVTPETPEVVVKYRWHDHLRLERPDLAELFPVPVFFEEQGGGASREVSFIGVRLRGDALRRTPLRIGYRVAPKSAVLAANE